ncbi:MAG TPA: hypothetical protein VFV19_19880 [Candidatus Polarisedimenticolaceae bacterium]|nr:hypothetical protein [Candidatus Polarisedimenticolaceae bacterium]
MRRSLGLGAAALALAAVAWSGDANAQACANPCTDAQVTVNLVYFGSTAANPSINQAMKSLYGDPVNTCTSVIKVYRCKRDLDGNPGNGAETCVRAFVGDNLGSCEGVNALDNKLSNFNVCDPNAAGAPSSGSGGLKAANLLSDEIGNPLYANFAGSDVSYGNCEPVVSNAQIGRPNIFDDTETNVFVNGFGFIVNRGIEPLVNARAKTVPASGCPYAAGDCVKLDGTMSMTPQKGFAIWGANNSCDWRFFSKDVDPSAFRNIGTVMRNRLSGTRRYFNIQVLENSAPGQGDMFVSGSGAMVTAVNGNQWCGTNAAACGENQSTGVLGGGAVSAACTGTNANTISLGVLGGDRFTSFDPGTPADPHDDWAIRNNAADNYDVLPYEGTHYNKANIRCGRYQYWTVEREYYDNDANIAVNGRRGYFFPAGSIKEKAILELFSQLTIDASTDPTLVPLTDMFFSRARDGSAPFPSKAYATFCNEP